MSKNWLKKIFFDKIFFIKKKVFFLIFNFFHDYSPNFFYYLFCHSVCDGKEYALRVFPAETRLTVYRRHGIIFHQGLAHSASFGRLRNSFLSDVKDDTIPTKFKNFSKKLIFFFRFFYFSKKLVVFFLSHKKNQNIICEYVFPQKLAQKKYFFHKMIFFEKNVIFVFFEFFHYFLHNLNFFLVLFQKKNC